ncbi:MAG: hypothetical protein HGB21_13425 [Nitrospirae bacterium]|nr:hypothetical protein [Nitrospirota bacterium]
MKILEPLSKFTTQELLKMMVGRSVLWYGAGFSTTMLLSYFKQSKMGISYAGAFGIIALLVLIIAESMYTRKKIIPEVLRRCNKQ